MKVVQINPVYGVGSTGRIALDIQAYLKSKNIDARCIYGYGREDYPDTYKMQGMLELKYNIARGRISGHHGFYNKHVTHRAIEYLKEFDPDVVHLHNIHGYYINIGMLFDYIKTYHKKVVWTFHDCWPFTGHCAHFDYINCAKWKKGCQGCPGWKEYLILGKDRADRNLTEKKELFCNIEDLTIVTPSVWLADLVRKSFLNIYPIRVIHNGIDTSVFRPVNSNVIKKQLGIDKEKVVLGIVPDLDGNKNGRHMVELAKRLGSEYIVVLLSLKTKEKLPTNILVLPRTNSTQRLAELYSMADVFVNPTLEDNYPTVNLESTACGTPVVTYNTGGSPEGVMEHFGEVVEKGNLDQLTQSVRKWAHMDTEYLFQKIDVSSLDKNVFAKKYLKLYSGDCLELCQM